MFSVTEQDDSNRSVRKRLEFRSNEESPKNKKQKKNQGKKEDKKIDDKKQEKKSDDKSKKQNVESATPRNVVEENGKKYFEPDKSLKMDIKDKKSEKWNLPVVTKSSYFKCEFKNVIVEFFNYDGIDAFFSNMNTKSINIVKGDVGKGTYYQQYNFSLFY